MVEFIVLSSPWASGHHGKIERVFLKYVVWRGASSLPGEQSWLCVRLTIPSICKNSPVIAPQKRSRVMMLELVCFPHAARSTASAVWHHLLMSA